MFSPKKSNKKHLMARIEDNYTCFKCSLRSASREKLFEMAGRIAAVTEAYEFLTKKYKWDYEGEIDYLLFFRDPLTMIADAWERDRKERLPELDCMITEVYYNDEVISQYPIMEGIASDLLYVGDPAEIKTPETCEV